MKYQIKNITGDITNPDPDLHTARKLYATSDQLQQLLPIDAGETAFVSSKAYVELSFMCSKYFQVLDADGSPDSSVTYRLKATMSATWQAFDLGRFAGKIEITNTHASNTIQFSLSGGVGLISAGGTPLASTISDVLPKETVTMDAIISPVRFIYLLGSSAAEVVYVLVD